MLLVKASTRFDRPETEVNPVQLKTIMTVLSALWLVSGCGGEDDPMSSTGSSGSPGVALGDAGLSTPSTGITGGTTGAPPGGSVSGSLGGIMGPLADAGQPPTGTRSDSAVSMGDGGTSSPGFDAAAGSDAAAGDDAGAQSGPRVPKIPEAPAECPAFRSGTSAILGITATIEAGAPGSVKGAIVFGFHGTAGAGAGDLPASVKRELMSEGGMLIKPRYNTRRYDAMTDIAPPTGTWYVSDMEWVDRVVACAVKNANIDPNRIYATGCSAGGLMAGSIGLMRSEYMAAVAPNSGGINYMGSRMLSSPRGPAAFLMHGGSGDSVIINFQTSSQWFEEANKKAATLPYMLDCNHGRGHCGAPTALFEMAWEFFKAHPFNVVDSPWKTQRPANLPTYCKEVE